MSSTDEAARSHLAKLAIVALALSPVFAGQAPGRTQAGDYSKRLADLDQSQPESTCIARDLLRDLVPAANVEERDDSFRAFRAFYSQSVLTTTSAFQEAMDKYSGEYEDWLQTKWDTGQTHEMAQFFKDRPDIVTAGSRWFDCGFSMQDGEGSLIPDADSPILLAFAGNLSSDLAQYVRFRANEDRDPIGTGDAALLITWEQLRARIERWEAFERSHPDLLETKKEVQPQIHDYVAVYILGEANTPDFDEETGILAPDLRASWKQFAAHDRSSHYYEFLSSLLAAVDEHNGRLSEEDRPLFARFGFAGDFDPWWRSFQIRFAPK